MSRRILQGVVESAKCPKTVSVKVTKRIMHPIYKKYITRTSKYLAHDEHNSCAPGDEVRIRECRPISKRKCWEVLGSSQSAKEVSQ